MYYIGYISNNNKIKKRGKNMEITNAGLTTNLIRNNKYYVLEGRKVGVFKIHPSFLDSSRLIGIAIIKEGRILPFYDMEGSDFFRYSYDVRRDLSNMIKSDEIDYIAQYSEIKELFGEMLRLEADGLLD